MNDYPILTTPYWTTYLAEKQVYLGRCVIVCNRDCPDLSSLSAEEWTDLHKVVQELEAACRQGLGATMFNWSCLMNDAYKNTPATPHVHWHMKPRYDHPVNIDGQIFNDPNFAHHYDTQIESSSEPATPEIRQVIADKIIQALVKD